MLVERSNFVGSDQGRIGCPSWVNDGLGSVVRQDWFINWNAPEIRGRLVVELVSSLAGMLDRAHGQIDALKFDPASEDLWKR